MDYIPKTEFLFFAKKAPSLPGRDGYKSSIAVTLFRGFYFPNLVGTLEHGLVGGDLAKIQASQPAQTWPAEERNVCAYLLCMTAIALAGSTPVPMPRGAANLPVALRRSLCHS